MIDFSRQWHEANLDRLVPEVAAALDAWLGRDREDWRASNRAAGRLQMLMRSVSAEASAISAIDSREHWWGVRAQREPEPRRTRKPRPAPSFDAVVARMNGVTE